MNFPVFFYCPPFFSSYLLKFLSTFFLEKKRGLSETISSHHIPLRSLKVKECVLGGKGGVQKQHQFDLQVEENSLDRSICIYLGDYAILCGGGGGGFCYCGPLCYN
jgi:hypothetical protein